MCNFVALNKLAVVDIYETKVRDHCMRKVRENIIRDWSFVNNNDLDMKGGIWVAWNQNEVDMNVISRN